MKKLKKISDKVILHPMISFLVLALGIIVLSGVLDLFGASVTFSSINPRTGTYTSTLITVDSLFSLSGIKYIFSNTVSNFVEFGPLASLLIILIGIGIMDRSGFLDTIFFLLTKKVSKRIVTFVLAFVCLLTSITGDLVFVIMIPISALLFKYGKRNPMAGIVTAFAATGIGYGINLGISGIDSSLINTSQSVANILSKDYVFNTNCYLFIMIAAMFVAAAIITYITERIVVPKLGKYVDEEEIIEDKEKLTKREKRGLIFASIGCGIYLLVFIYNIIPGAPLGGAFLNYNESRYIDMLFGPESFFSNGYVFIVTFLFFIAGLLYGLGSKKIENHRDVADYLSHSLDGIGKVITLLFVASIFVSLLTYTKIGALITGYLINLIADTGLGGVVLFIIVFALCFISTLFMPSFTARWNIMAGTLVSLMMTTGFSPEFAQLTFSTASSVAYIITPAMAYFVIYVSYMEKYGKDKIGVRQSIRLLLPYSLSIGLMWIVLLLLWFIIGIPLGIATPPVL